MDEKQPLNLVFGASSNPERYAYIATKMLLDYNKKVALVGLKKDEEVLGLKVNPFGTTFNKVDTITLYLGPKNQESYYDYILSLKPRRIIFNPGTENEELQRFATQNNIAFENACTLVLLSTKQY